MRPITVSVGPLAAASATNIRTASAFVAGVLTLNGALVSGGVVTMDKPRPALFTFAGDETGNSFAVVGTNWSGQPISETVAGTAPGTVATVLDYKTITSITAALNGAGNLSIGTNGTAGSPWVALDPWAFAPVSVQVNVSGTVNYSIQVTSQDPNSPTDVVAPGSVVFTNCADSNLVSKTGNAIGSLAAVPLYARIFLNSGTGTATAVFTQPGVVNR